jgi:hypothetical protein
MKTAAIGMVGVLLFAGGLYAQKTPSSSVRINDIFTGEITDSICTEGHHIAVLKSERNCVLTCVKLDGAQFVLYNPETNRIYKLDDQQKPEAFAGQEVTVSGTYDKDEKVIHVTNIRPKITYASAGL